MIKVLIIDDEKIIREGLKKIVSDNCPELTVVGEAPDGKKALEITNELRPDICIVDMKMNIMEGPEYIRLAREKQKNIKFIVLSGYADFNYAREVVGLGCSEYLLKPVKHNEIINVLNRLKDEILLDRQESEKGNNIKSQAEEAAKYRKESFLKQILEGNLPKDCDKQLKLYNLEFLMGKFYTAVIDIDSFYTFQKKLAQMIWESGEFDRYSLQELAQSALDRNILLKGTAFLIGEREVVLVFSPKKDKLLPDNSVLNFLYGLRSDIAKRTELSVTMGFCGPYSGIEEIPQSYKRCRQAVENRFYTVTGRIYRYEGEKEKEQYPYLHEEEKKLILHITLNNGELVCDGITRILDLIEQTKVAQSTCIVILGRLYLTITNYLKEKRNDDILNSIPSYKDFESQIKSFDTFTELNVYIRKLFVSIEELIRTFSDKTRRKTIRKALSYIEENYKKDIGLNEISQFVGMNPSYFSVLFKKEMGENITNFLIKYKMEKAIELLSNVNYKVYEVGEIIGYSDSKYFCKTFKKVIGVTPSEYRDGILKSKSKGGSVRESTI